MRSRYFPPVTAVALVVLCTSAAPREVPVDNVRITVARISESANSSGNRHGLDFAGPRLPRNTWPLAAAYRLLAAYAARDVSSLDSLLTRDFRFTSDDSEFATRAPSGFSRDDELAFAVRLFSQIVSLRVHLEPRHEDTLPGPACCQPAGSRVIATGVTLMATLQDGSRLQAGPTMHVIEVIRGDLAELPAGRSSDSLHYFVRRWQEYTRNDNPTALLARARPPRGRGEPDSTEQSTGSVDSTAKAPVAPTVLAIRPSENPARGSVRLALALPTRESARLEVYDIAGRRVRTRDFEPAEPRMIRVDLRDQGALPAGVYWLRLRQAAREVHTRVVLLH